MSLCLCCVLQSCQIRRIVETVFEPTREPGRKYWMDTLSFWDIYLTASENALGFLYRLKYGLVQRCRFLPPMSFYNSLGYYLDGWPIHALAQVDGGTWTSDCHAPDRVPPSPVPELLKWLHECHLHKCHCLLGNVHDIALIQVISQTVCGYPVINQKYSIMGQSC